MAVFRSLRRRLMVWFTYLCVCFHHSCSEIFACKLQREITNWQTESLSLLNISWVSRSTNFIFRKTASVTTKLTVVRSLVDISVKVCCSNQTSLGLLPVSVISSSGSSLSLSMRMTYSLVKQILHSALRHFYLLLLCQMCWCVRSCY